MSEEYHPESGALIPEDADWRLSLPADLVRRGLELAKRIEQQQGIQKVDEPLLKFPGVLPRSCIAFSRDGRFAAITCHGKQRDNPGLVIWEIVTKGSLSIFPDAGRKGAALRDIHSVALSSRGDHALVGYGDGIILRFKIEDHIIYPLGVIARDPHGRAITALAFSPDGKLFAECAENTVRIRDAATGREMRRIPGLNRFYSQLVFSNDGSKLLIAGCALSGRGGEGGMILIDLSNRQGPLQFRKGLLQARAVSLFPHGDRAVSLEEGGSITVWNTRNGKEISRWKHTEADVGDLVSEKRHQNNPITQVRNPSIWGLSSVAVSPDGSRILSGGGDTFLRLWTTDGRMIREYPHDSRVVKVAFTPDGQRALAGGWNGSVWVWQLP